VSHDKTIRFWDLHTRHEIDVVERAHDTPINCLEYCEQHEELATCASEPIVKIWCSFKHSLKLVLAPHQADVSQVRILTEYAQHLLKVNLCCHRHWREERVSKSEIRTTSYAAVCIVFTSRVEGGRRCR
jgi:WD40 repeat protein